VLHCPHQEAQQTEHAAQHDHRPQRPVGQGEDALFAHVVAALDRLDQQRRRADDDGDHNDGA
jgi:hypothetical protein